MVIENIRSRMIKGLEDEPLYLAARLVKCGTCLLIIGGLTFIGAVSEPPTDRSRLQGQFQEPATHGSALDPEHEGRMASSQPAATIESSTDLAGEANAVRPSAIDVSCRGVC